MKEYTGIREGNRVNVCVDGEPLNPRLDLQSHSPSGFEWGYGGSGSAQLALALLAEHLEDDGLAEDLHQSFKWAVVANLPHSRWILTGDEINKILEGLRAL
jgi:hypothetical protein